MFELTQDVTHAAGFNAYEISNHAKPGAESVHNLIYWRSGDWAGIGPGSHGRLTLDGTRFETMSHKMPTDWLTSMERSGSGYSDRQRIMPDDIRTEAVLMGLRLNEGIPAAWIPETAKVETLVKDGLIETTPECIRTTVAGRPLLNAILRELLA
jgi:oxygen-independent coproporphyrinogen-3 oxidase